MHGAYYYDFKPALKIAKIIDAIESKYSITFTSDFFADSKFTDLYLWGHRRGYIQGSGEWLATKLISSPQQDQDLID